MRKRPKNVKRQNVKRAINIYTNVKIHLFLCMGYEINFHSQKKNTNTLTHMSSVCVLLCVESINTKRIYNINPKHHNNNNIKKTCEFIIQNPYKYATE